MQKKKILVIDDEEGFLKLVKLILERTGSYTVQTASDGVTGFAAMATFQPDLILLDVMLGGDDGAEIARQIEADETLKHVPIIFVTGLVTKEESAATGGFIGQHTFLAKPISAQELIARVEESLQTS